MMSWRLLGASELSLRAMCFHDDFDPTTFLSKAIEYAEIFPLCSAILWWERSPVDFQVMFVFTTAVPVHECNRLLTDQGFLHRFVCYAVPGDYETTCMKPSGCHFVNSPKLRYRLVILTIDLMWWIVKLHCPLFKTDLPDVYCTLNFKVWMSWSFFETWLGLGGIRGLRAQWAIRKNSLLAYGFAVQAWSNHSLAFGQQLRPTPRRYFARRGWITNCVFHIQQSVLFLVNWLNICTYIYNW